MNTSSSQGAGTQRTGRQSWKTLIHIAGVVFSVGALAWFGYALSTQWEVFRGLELNVQSVGAMVLGVALYPVIYAIAAGIWVYSLRCIGIRLPFRSAVGISFVSQFGKYIPGNVAHHVARVVLAQRHGASTRHVVLSMVLETACLILCGGAVALFVLIIDDTLRERLGKWIPRREVIAVMATMLLVAFAVGIVVAKKMAGRIKGGTVKKNVLRLRWFVHCVGLALIIYLLHGVITKTVLVGVFEVDSVSLVAATGLFAFAWVVGFVTPGAPAGLGVREAVLTLGLGPVCDPGVAVGLAAMLRVVSSLGDGLTFGLGMWLQRSSR